MVIGWVSDFHCDVLGEWRWFPTSTELRGALAKATGIDKAGGPVLATAAGPWSAVTAAGQEGSRCETGAGARNCNPGSRPGIRHLPRSVVRPSRPDQPWSVVGLRPAARFLPRDDFMSLKEVHVHHLVILAAVATHQQSPPSEAARHHRGHRHPSNEALMPTLSAFPLQCSTPR